VDRLHELDGLSSLADDVVLDGEVAVVTADGRADFELLATRVHGPRHTNDGRPVTFFVFDVLQFAGRNQTDEPWRAPGRSSTTPTSLLGVMGQFSPPSGPMTVPPCLRRPATARTPTRGQRRGAFVVAINSTEERTIEKEGPETKEESST
jgi:hypothetical protein